MINMCIVHASRLPFTLSLSLLDMIVELNEDSEINILVSLSDDSLCNVYGKLYFTYTDRSREKRGSRAR